MSRAKYSARFGSAEYHVLAHVCAENPVLAETRVTAREFVRVLRELDAAAFDAWQNTAVTSPLVRFARTLERDGAAVRNAVALSWSNGGTEGHVNRLEFVKRGMYGRAGVALLGRRVIAA